MSRREKYSYLEIFLQKSSPTLRGRRFVDIKRNLRNKPITLLGERKSKTRSTKQKKCPRLKNRIMAKPTNSTYDDYGPLRALWREYIDDLFADCQTVKPEDTATSLDTKHAQEILLKADYHGADLDVVDSPCSSHKGISGTVVQETKNLFLICSKQNRLVKIPKKKTIFSIEYPVGYRVTIFGSQFCFKPSHRLTKRFNKNPMLKDLLR